MVRGPQYVTTKLDIDGREVVIRPVEHKDVPGVARFAAALSSHDLLFMSRDIQHARVIDAWMEAVKHGEMDTLVAISGDEIVATSGVLRDPLGWSAHVFEIRLIVSPSMRGKGLGRTMLDKCVGLAIEGGAKKLCARMTPDQSGAITLFEEAGFRGEALLRDEVCDRDGKYHDLAVLALHPERVAARRNAFGEEKDS
ncbi:GNAT family N-acetyltransferase [Sphingomonas antarctica]